MSMQKQVHPLAGKPALSALLSVCGLLLSAGPAWATTYAIDADHTTVGFKIRHLFSKVSGTFDRVEGSFDYVPGHPEQWKAAATIQAASINTRVAERDKHLRSKDFFETEIHPTIVFTGTGVTEATAAGATLNGVLTIRGVQQPVSLNLEFHGEAKDPWGNQRSGWTATTTINRKDFGLTWNQAVETGQLLVGEEVEITLEVEGIVK